MTPYPLISAAAIATRLSALSVDIAARYDQRAVVMVVLMDGAFCFAADLCRALPGLDVRLHFQRASSYRGTLSSGTVTLAELPDLTGADVLLVDDILDTGRTLAAAVAATRAAGASSVATCVLLDKPARRVADGLPSADHVGFTIPDHFIVGYGLDLDGKFRHLPDVCVLK